MLDKVNLTADVSRVFATALTLTLKGLRDQLAQLIGNENFADNVALEAAIVNLATATAAVVMATNGPPFTEEKCDAIRQEAHFAVAQAIHKVLGKHVNDAVVVLIEPKKRPK